MPNRSFAPRGIFAIVIACIATSVIITEETGMYSHWPLLIASLIVGFLSLSVIRWLRGIPVDRDISLNLLAGELAVG